MNRSLRLFILASALTLVIAFGQASGPAHQRLPSFDGVELAYYSQGTGRTVLLLHAFMVVSTTWLFDGT